jgi:hypothetical protein
MMIFPEDMGKIAKEKEATRVDVAAIQASNHQFRAETNFLSKEATCPDGTIVSNAPDGDTGFTSSVDADFINYQSLPDVPGGVVGGISFWAIQGFFDGLGWSECSSDPMDVVVSFYNDNSGLPGTEIATETISFVPVPDPEIVFGTWTVKKFTAYFASPVSITSGWFSVASTNNPTCWSLIINSLSGTGVSGFFDAGVWTARETPQAFCLLEPLADDNAPAAPTALTVTPADMGALSATIDWTNPALTFNGSDLTELTQVNVNRNGELLTTIDNPTIGGVEQFVDNTITEAGTYTYSVYGVNTAGDGPAVGLSVYIGEDVPAAPADITLVAQGNDGLVTWTAPTTGLNGGYLSGTGLTYTVVRDNDAVEVATDITETQILDNTVPGIGNYTYTVTASNAIGEGGSATSNVALLGADGVLMYETFDYTTGVLPPGWSIVGLGDGNWTVNNSFSAGGETPELRFNWSPEFLGETRILSYPINTDGNEQLRFKFNQYLSNYSTNEGEVIKIDVTFDGGSTFVNLWEYLVEANVPVGEYELYIDVPAGKSEMHLSFYFSGNSYNINQWYLDNMIVEPVLDNDLVAVSLTGNTTPSAGATVTYTATVQNAGTLTQTDYTVKLMQEGDIELASVPGTSIDFGASATFDLEWVLSTDETLGSTFIYAVVELVADENTSNNQTANLNVDVQSSDVIAVTIGDGEVLTTSPYNFVWDYSIQQTLYYPEEIGVGGGVLTGIQYTNSFNEEKLGKEIMIWVGETDMENLADGWVDPATLQLVFNGTVDFPAGVNNIYIPFDDIYVYGGGNLVVYNYKMDNEWTSGKNFFNTDDPESNRTIRAQQDGTPFDPAAPPAGTAANNFPNTTFFFSTAGLGALEGTVTDGVDPIEGVEVSVLGTNSSTVTAADGTYSFPYLLPDTYNVEFSLFGYTTEVVEAVEIVEDQTTVADATLTALATYTVAGTVTGNDGLDLEGAVVTIEGYDNYETTTDASGVFSVADVFEGTYTITVAATGYDTYTDAALVVDQALDLDITLTETIVAPGGLMVDVDGQEEGNALLTWGTGGAGWTESFEVGAIPEGWSQIINNTTSQANIPSTWHITGTVELETPVAPQDGEYQAFMMWSYGFQDEWLITPEFKAPAGDLVFWYYGNNGSPNADNYYVKVSTDGGTTWDILWNASELPEGENYYAVPAIIDLSAYAGQDIHIAWNNSDGPTDDGVWFAWGIDNITVGGQKIDVRDLFVASNPTQNGINQAARDGKFRKPISSIEDMNYSGAEKAFVGYNVFLGETQVATEIAGSSYLFEGLAEGSYTAGVQSVYSTGTSAVVTKDFEIVFGVPATITVTTNSGDSPEGAVVTLTNQDNEAYVYTHTVAADGVAAFESVRKGMYTMHIAHDNFHDYVMEDVDIQAEFTHTAELIEIIEAPYGLMVETEGLAGNEAHFSWNNTIAGGSFADSFEDSTFDKWFEFIQGTGTPGSDGGNPYWYVTETDNATTPEGVLVAKANWGYTINTWLISPELGVDETTSISFWWNSSYYWHVDPNPNGELMVKVSTDGGVTWTEVWNWQEIGVWENWVWYETIIPLADYAGENIHVAFQLLANDNATTEIDYVQIGSAGKSGTFAMGTAPVGVAADAKFYHAPKAEKSFVGYNVFLNDVEVATEITETEYMFTDLPGGTHTAGVQTVYTSGTSDILEMDFTVEGVEPETFPVTFTVTDGTSLDYQALRIKGSMTDPQWADINLTEGDNSEWKVTLNVLPGSYEWGITEDDGSEFGIWLLPAGNNLMFSVSAEGTITGTISYTLDDTSVEDLLAGNIKMYPNPANNVITIASGIVMQQVRILDLSGRVVYTASETTDQLHVNVRTFESGVYFVQIVTMDGTFTGKLQIQK